MQVNSIPLKVTIGGPAHCAGTYNYREGSQDLWTWYKEGEEQTAWHFTVSSRHYDTAPNGEWVGFHVSVPMGGANVHICFRIRNGTVVFHHIAGRDYIPHSERQRFDTLYQRESAVILEFARNIHHSIAGLNSTTLGAARAGLRHVAPPTEGDGWKRGYLSVLAMKRMEASLGAKEFVPGGGPG